MDLQSATKFLIKQTGLRPDKLKGQNFCLSQEVIDSVVNVAQITKEDTVLEIGPGFGFLTVQLVKKAKKVIAVELDKKLIPTLRKMEKVNQNLEIKESDILKIPIKDLGLTNLSYKVVANLPYNITSAFLKKFLTAQSKPKTMTLLIQKEVAERICASQGQMSLLAISIQLYGQPQIVEIVSSDNFWPTPKVDSAILKIDKIQAYPFANQVNEKIFWQVTRSGFAAKRKQLQNNLKNSLHLNSQQVEQMLDNSRLKREIRAQELNVNDWLKLAKSYQEFNVDVGK